MARRSLFLCTAAALLLPSIASALTVTVRYDVDATALKSAVAGTVLTYNLYGDDACTDLVSTQMVNSEDIDSIEVVKRIAVKGGTKPPKMARTSHAFSINPPRWIHRATVTGTGITPIGGACQAQQAAPATAVKSSVPSGVISVGAGFTELASLTVSLPSDGYLDVEFETLINAKDVNQFLLCTMGEGVASSVFYADPGDKDSPIPFYDMVQTHRQVMPMTAGTHTISVECNANGGLDIDTIYSQIIGTFYQAGM
jgi:hypothetical protein